ncbi:MAG: DoxX family protein [Tannerella sp.]|jgi:putative oxidoreductase|nr:DoxX family protein [Tannerella sp.]
MRTILNFLFPVKPDAKGYSLLLLSFRILFGILLMIHGVQKLSHFGELSGVFPDPLGVGSSVSLGLAIFGELACSIGFIFGAFYRLALIPMIFTMIVAFFIIHGGDPFGSKELPFVYMIVFIIMYITGPGKYSLDAFIARAIREKGEY